MKVTCFIDDLTSGGAQRQLVALAESFREDGNEVEFVIYHQVYFYLDYLKSLNINVTLLECRSGLDRIIKLRRYLKKSKPNAVIAFMGIPSFIAALASVPDKSWVLILGERSASPGLLKSLKSRLIRYTHFISNYVVSNSVSNLHLVRQINPFLSQNKLKVIYNSIDLNKYLFNHEFEFKSDDKLKIIVPASYRKLKNPVGLINALNKLSDEEKAHIKVDWYGDKSYDTHPDNVLKACEELIAVNNLHGVIELKGRSNEIQKLLPSYDAVGLFSFFEGLPNAICEGMACGKPVICSAISDLPSFLNDNVNGYLFNPNSNKELLIAIRKLLGATKSDLMSMGLVNRQLAEKMFDKNEIYNQYKVLIERKNG